MCKRAYKINLIVMSKFQKQIYNFNTESVVWLNFVLIWVIVTGTFNFLMFSIHNKLINNLASKEENTDRNAEEAGCKQFWLTL